MSDFLRTYRELEHEIVHRTITGRSPGTIRAGTARIEPLLALLGNPHHSFRSIHITGTSGKTSATLFTAAILAHAGLRFGSFISPHLQVMHERMRVNGHCIPTARLRAVFERVIAAADMLAGSRPLGAPSYFEVQVAMACCFFAEERVDGAVIEVGIGGRMDATNVLLAEVAVITSVGLDHTELLGDTIEQIGAEKVGIIKPGQTVISAVTQPVIQDLVASTAAQAGARYWQVGREIQRLPGVSEDSITMPGGVYAIPSIQLEFQQWNAACAIAAAHVFTGGVTQQAVHAGIRPQAIPGRMEILQERPLVVIDGAHNPDKMAAAAQGIRSIASDRPCVLVLAVKATKDIYHIIQAAAPGMAHIFCTAFSIPGGGPHVPPQNLAAAVRMIVPQCPLSIVPSPTDATEQAMRLVGADGVVWVTGSLFLVGNVRELWHPSAVLVEGIDTSREIFG